MKLKNNSLDFNGQEIFIGIDVHLKSWYVTILTEDFEHKAYSMTPDCEVLCNYLKKVFPGGKYKAVYETGFSGYWIRKKLQELGIECIVTHAADVPQTDKTRKNKTDRIDSRRLAKALRSSQLTGIYVPSGECLSARVLLRTREMIVRNQTRCKNRLKSILYFFGYCLTETQIQSYWTKAYIEKIKALETEDINTRRSLDILLEDLNNNQLLLKSLDKQIHELSESDKYSRESKLLRTIPGIGLLSSMIILTEIMDIRRFKCFDKLNSYAGLLPVEHSSGERVIKSDITSRRNSRLRHVLVESSWTAVRKDPALLQSYKQFKQRGVTTNKAIIKIARKLLSRINYVLTNNTVYSIGVVQ